MPMKKMTIIDTTVIKTGTSDSGKTWTLYDVTAVSEDGQPIEEKLKSFDDLQGNVEVEVERSEHAKYGVSYMLKLPRGGGGAPPAGANPAPAGARLGPKVDELRERVERLETDVVFLREVIARMNPQAIVNTPPPPAPSRGATF